MQRVCQHLAIRLSLQLHGGQNKGDTSRAYVILHQSAWVQHQLASKNGDDQCYCLLTSLGPTLYHEHRPAAEPL